jgi:hypothetical protein
MNDWNLLRKCSGYPIHRRKLPDTESCDNRRDTLDAGIAIGSISWRGYRLAQEPAVGDESDIPAFNSLAFPTHFRPDFGI